MILILCGAFVSTLRADPPPGFFRFDDKGQVKTPSGSAERTFAFPTLKIGFIYDVANPDIVPDTTLELLAWDWFDQNFSIDGGVALHRVVVGLSFKFLQPFDLGPFIWLGYHIPDQAFAWGLGFSLVKFLD